MISYGIAAMTLRLNASSAFSFAILIPRSGGGSFDLIQAIHEGIEGLQKGFDQRRMIAIG